MSQNILITGASGYLGGSIIADILAHSDGPLKPSQIIAACRTSEQAQNLSILGVKIIELDVNDSEAVKQAIVDNEIDIVVNNTNAWLIPVMASMIEALGQRRHHHGREVFFIQSSVATTFSPEAGWTYGDIEDTDATILQKEKTLDLGHPVRAANIHMIELGQRLDVNTLIMALPQVCTSTIFGETPISRFPPRDIASSFAVTNAVSDGRGGGQIRKLSVNTPAHIRAAMADKVVYQFDQDGSQVGAHVSDVTALYRLILERIVKHEPVPSGEHGYYWVVAHRVSHWKMMKSLAEALYARGLINESQPKAWADDATAGEHLQFPTQYVRAMITATPSLVPVQGRELGWQPRWDEEKFLTSMDEEVRDVLELDTVKSGLFAAWTGK